MSERIFRAGTAAIACAMGGALIGEFSYGWLGAIVGAALGAAVGVWSAR